MKVRNYSLALIIGSFVSSMALAQAPATTPQQPVEKSTVEQTSKTTAVKHKDPASVTASTSTTADKSMENKSTDATHAGKHVAKATTTAESSKSVVTKKEDASKPAEKAKDIAPSANQSSK